MGLRRWEHIKKAARSRRACAPPFSWAGRGQCLRAPSGASYMRPLVPFDVHTRALPAAALSGAPPGGAREAASRPKTPSHFEWLLHYWSLDCNGSLPLAFRGARPAIPRAGGATRTPRASPPVVAHGAPEHPGPRGHLALRSGHSPAPRALWAANRPMAGRPGLDGGAEREDKRLALFL